MRSYQPFQQAVVTRQNTSMPLVMERFKTLDFQNRQLLKLAENIQRSSFMAFNSPPPQIIHRLEQELRRNLSILIDSIREVFIDMDKRLRALAQVIEQQSAPQNNMAPPSNFMSSYSKDSMQRQRQNTFYMTNQSSVDAYSSLVERISSLEVNLKNTQQNQAKLISIIERFERRREEQPTITSEIKYEQRGQNLKDFSTQNAEKSRLDSSNSQNSFRLFALRSQYPTENPTQNQYQNKMKAEKEPISMIKQKKSQPNPFICFGQPQSDSLEPSRFQPPMPPVSFEKNYASTHSHRLNFMMNTLNS